MNPLLAYQRTQAQTAAPVELVVMLYRGAARSLSAAVAALEARRLEEAHNQLLKSQAIVAELQSVLDFERGGDIARHLGAIYPYWLSRLVDANVQKDASLAREVEAHVRSMLEAWEYVARQSAPRPLAMAA